MSKRLINNVLKNVIFLSIIKIVNANGVINHAFPVLVPWKQIAPFVLMINIYMKEVVMIVVLKKLI